MLVPPGDLRRGRVRARFRRTQPALTRFGGANSLRHDCGDRRGCVAATDAPAARRRFALVSFAERRGVGPVALDLERRDSLLVVSSGLGALRNRALRRKRPVRAAVERIGSARARRVSHRGVGSRGHRSAAPGRCARGRDRDGLSARDPGRHVAERRLACGLLARESLVATREDSGRRCDADAPRCRADQTAGLDTRRARARCGQSAAQRLARYRGRTRALDSPRRNRVALGEHSAGEQRGGGRFRVDDRRARSTRVRPARARRRRPLSVSHSRHSSRPCSAPLISRREARLAWAACGSALLFFILPFGYATSVAQLATGASLRFAAPAIVAGAVVLARPAQRAGIVATLLLLASTLFGVANLLGIFWNDGGTHVALVVAAIAAATAAIAGLTAAGG